MSKNYYLRKDNKKGELVSFDYGKIKGYPITPKTKIEDAISVNKIIFVNPSLRKKLLEKKVNVKIKLLLKSLQDMDENGTNEGAIQQSLMDAERLRLNIIHYYVKYFGNTYASYSLHKIQLITNQLKMRLYRLSMQRRIMSQFGNSLYYLDDEDVKKGRGR